MIQAIVYDAVGTLIHVTPSVAEIYAEVGRRFGSRLGASEIRCRFSLAFDKQEQLDAAAGWRTSETRERTRWRNIVAQVLDDVADQDGCFETLFAAFSMIDCWRCDPDADAVLMSMQRRGVRQALASNFDSRLHGLVAALPMGSLLERVVVSSEIGWRKPAPEFFTHVVETLQLPPKAILHVGDDLANDFEAARTAGMKSVLFDPQRRHLDVTERIERLADLLRWV